MKDLNKKSKTSIIILLLILMVVISSVVVLFLRKENFAIDKPRVDYENILGNNNRCIIERKLRIKLEKINNNYYEVIETKTGTVKKDSLIKKEDNNYFLISKKGMLDITKKVVYFDFLCE